MKQKVHLTAVFCALSLAVMFLPIATIVEGDSIQNVSGLDASQRSVAGFIMFLGPILLLAMNDFKRLERYEKLLSIAVPAVCLIAQIVLIVQMKYNAGQTKILIGAGAILDGLLYMGTALAGAVEYHNLTLDQEGVERLKEGSIKLFQATQERLYETARHVSRAAGEEKTGAETAAGGGETGGCCVEGQPGPGQLAHSVPQPEDLNCADKLLTLIDRLYQMKESGVISEEEFSEKKKKLLAAL